MKHPRTIPEPFLLEVFLTNRCNMDCSYCASRHMITQKTGRALSFGQLKAAVDVYAAYGRDGGGPRRVSVTGGEPLLEFDTLKRFVRYVRRRYPGFEIKVVTNATLLDREKAEFFFENDVFLVISLDGCREEHDRHRVFGDGAGRSAFDAVLRNLRRLPAGMRRSGNFCVSTVITSETVASLPRTLRFFEELGFRQVALGFDEYEMWKPDGIRRLERALAEIKERHFRGIVESGDLDDLICFSFVASYRLESQRLLSDYFDVFCREVTLMFDGYFYPGEAVFGMSGEEKYRIGTPRTGIDFGRVREIYSEAFPVIRRYGENVGVIWPVSRYFHAANRGVDPDAMIGNAVSVNAAFDRVFGPYWRIQKVLLLLKSDAAFGDFAHRPKYLAGRETGRLRLAVSGISGLAGLRAATDYFLYSPGKKKSLVLEAVDPSARTLDAAEGMILYSVMKARSLGKKLELTLEADASCLDAGRWRYLTEHGVRIGIKTSVKSAPRRSQNPRCRVL
ncbi:MAG TPA: radical SAM protein [Elusimicrobiales bacterium]|nr:radical SAM protein [Elusimicrobiales bacterium]